MFFQNRRSIQSAFDGGGSSHSLKIPANITGLYGTPYSDMGHIEDMSFGRNSTSSPIKHLTKKLDSITEGSSRDHYTGESEKEDKASNLNTQSLNDANGNDDLLKESELTSKSIFGQMEDAVTKAKLIAAQQFLLQNFQKQREALVSAQNLSHIPTLPNDGKMVTPFPFSPFPFSLPPSSMTFPSLPNMSKNNNRLMDTVPFKKEGKEDVEEIDNDSDDKDEKSPQKSQTENAFLLFSQIQNYRRQLLESGNPKHSHDSIETNSIRPIEKLVAPF